MGHSTIVFHGVGFTTKDWKLEVWLHLLAREVDQMPNPTPWLITARDFWREQAKLSINGCLDAGLDDFLTDEERVKIVRSLAQRAFNSLHGFGERVPRDFLNNLCQPQPSDQWPQDVEAELFMRTGRALMKLLDRKMTGHEQA